MEKRKLKFLLEPITQEGISKYGRKTSKFIFKLKNDPKPCDDEEGNRSNTLEKDQISQSNGTMVEKPSIILYETNSIVDDDPLERKIDVEYPSVINIKKIEISSNLLQINKDIKPNESACLQKALGNNVNTTISSTQSNTKNMPTKTISFKRIKLEETEDLNNRNEDISKAESKKHPAICTSRSQKYLKKLLAKKNSEQTLSLENSNSPTTVQNKNSQVLQITGNSPNKLESDIQRIVSERVQAEESRLRAENERLVNTLNELKIKVEKASEVRSYQRERLTLSKLKENQEMLYYYIGFKDISLVNDMADKLASYFAEHEHATSEIVFEDQLIMTLMKLRRNYSLHDLAFRFRVNLSEAYYIIFNVIQGLHFIYYEQGLSCQPFPFVEAMQPCISEQFLNFPNCRVILESFKVCCEDPEGELESDLCTSFKFDRKIMFKGLIAISPTKQVIYCSDLYESSTTNAVMFKNCQFLSRLNSGDLIMADKSFDEILKILPTDIDLNISSFKKSLLTDKQIKHLNSKARAYIGRTTMQHLRRFSILNCIPLFLNSVAVKVFQLCATLVNLQPTICGQSDFGFSEQ